MKSDNFYEGDTQCDYFTGAKKLLRPQYVAAFLVLLSILCGYFIIPNFYYCYQDAHQKQPQLNTPEAVIYDSYELLFTDMLLEEYGETIENQNCHTSGSRRNAFSPKCGR